MFSMFTVLVKRVRLLTFADSHQTQTTTEAGGSVIRFAGFWWRSSGGRAGRQVIPGLHVSLLMSSWRLTSVCECGKCYKVL